MSVPRVLVVGWDGATWDVLQPMLDAGRLPNLQRLIERGVATSLRSTLPPVTASAWSSFMTGLLPARHGLLSWQRPLRTPDLRRPWINAQAIQGDRLWQRLDQAGLRVGLVNVPLTYPPQPVNGFLVSGMLTPGPQSNFTYPADLRQRLLTAIPDYTPDVDLQQTEWETSSSAGFDRFIAAVRRGTEQRLAAVRWLTQIEMPDFLMVVFEAPDRLQHLLWKDITEFPAPSSQLQKTDQRVIPNTQHATRHESAWHCYEQCDAALAQLPGYDDPNTWVIMLSDHGFGPLNTNLHLNDWLATSGYLHWAQGKSGLRHLLRKSIAPIKHLLPPAWLRRGRAEFNWLHTVDWAETIAYSGLPTEEGVWINLRGREPFGCVQPGSEYEQAREALIRELGDLRDPCTRQPVIVEVMRREERHQGPYTENAPDVVFTLARGYRMTPGRPPLNGVPLGVPYFQDVSTAGHGIHDPSGILVLSGAGVVAPQPLSDAHLVDLAPTILAAFGLPVPENLDGKVLLESFKLQVSPCGDFASFPLAGAGKLDVPPKPEIQTALNEQSPKPAESIYTSDEEDLLTERLRGLGYIE